MIYLLIFFSTLSITIFSVPYFIKFLEGNNAYDIPGYRKVHGKVTPRLGGIIIYCSSALLFLTFYNDLNSIRLIGYGSVIILFGGVIDDIIGLKYFTKFIFQCTSSLLIIIHFQLYNYSLQLFGLFISFPLNLILLLVFYVGVINAVNWLDGLDGLANGFSLTIFSVIFVIAYQANNIFLMMLASALIGSMLGFAKYNAYPAEIFLGDSGSMVLAYFILIAMTDISYNKYIQTLDLTIPILFLGYPLLDEFRVIVKRFMQGQSVFVGDNNHFHHIILNYKVRHKTAVFLLHGINILFITIALYYYKTSSFVPLILFIIISSFIFFAEKIIILTRSVFKLRHHFSNIEEFAAFIIRTFRKFIYKFSFVLLMFVFILSFPGNVSIQYQYLLILLFFVISSFVLAIYQKSVKQPFIQINVFFNLTIYFILYNKIRYDDGTNTLALGYNIEKYFLYCFIAFTFILIILITARQKIVPRDYLFLRGIDLTLIVLIVIMFVLRGFINDYNVTILSSSMLMAFICYLWYKFYIITAPQRREYFFYGSFAIPFIALLKLLLQ